MTYPQPEEQIGAMSEPEIDPALLARFNANPNPQCGCHKCNPNAWWMVVCDTCGNKRCPHATDHAHACTGSNEPGQKGSLYA